MVRIQRAEAEARKASLTDSLTGLYNRRFLHQRLEEEMARSQRHGSPLAEYGMLMLMTPGIVGSENEPMTP